MRNNSKEMKNLKKQPKWKLRDERQNLEESQRYLREKYQFLLKAYESQLDIRESAIKANDDATQKTCQLAIEKIKDLRKEIEDEYNANLDRIDKISKVLKSDSDKSNAVVGTAVGVVTGLGGLALGGLSLHKAYKSDQEGGMVHKKTLDVFNRLNPLRLFQKK